MTQVKNKEKKKGVVLAALDSVLYYLSPSDKRKSFGMFILLVVSSVLDVFGLASLVPVIMAASKPNSVFANKYSLWLYNALGFNSEKKFLVFLIVFILIFFILKNIFTTLVNYQQVRFTANVASNIVDDQFQKHSNLPFWEFSNIGSGPLVNGTVGIPQAYVNGVMRQLFMFFSEIIIIFIIVLGILIYQPLLFMILCLVLVPTTVITYSAIQKKVRNIGARIDELRPISYTILNDSFIGFVELKLAGKQKQFKDKLLKNQREVQDLEAVSYLFSQLPLKVIEVVAILAVTTIFLYSLLIADNPANLVTIIGLFAAAAYRLMPSVNRLITAMITMKQFQYTWESLEQHREYSVQKQIPVKQESLTFSQGIVFDHVSFSFPSSESPVLDEISFSVKKGERIGLIGTSGSGKTTLMNLLLRFYVEQQGRILVDGVPLSASNLESWYKIIGYVKQDTFLMDGSIQDNITLNDEHVDQQRLQYALEQASLLDFVEASPEGVYTKIGERGSRLSGGQRQRIGIARALYKKTQILVLDEATSALDNETEREVNEAIGKLAGTDITIFIIAHRLTTLRECNKIYEMKDGKIIAEHQYEDILSRLH